MSFYSFIQSQWDFLLREANIQMQRDNYELVLRTSTWASAALQTKLFDSFEEASRMA